MPVRQESKRSYSVLETDACSTGEQTKLFSVDTFLHGRVDEQSNILFWNERESLIGILIMPTENFWPEFFHRTCSPF